MIMNQFPNSDLPELPKCVGLSKTGKCTWLDIKACMGNDCKFKRSEEECRASRIRAFRRLASLEGSKQTYIANKYYHCRKPWKV